MRIGSKMYLEAKVCNKVQKCEYVVVTHEKGNVYTIEATSMYVEPRVRTIKKQTRAEESIHFYWYEHPVGLARKRERKGQTENVCDEGKEDGRRFNPENVEDMVNVPKDTRGRLRPGTKGDNQIFVEIACRTINPHLCETFCVFSLGCGIGPAAPSQPLSVLP